MEHLSIRLAVESDKNFFLEWLSEPGILDWFPMRDAREIEDAVSIWMNYIPQGAVLTAVWDGVPCGCANLYIQTYKKLSHQALFAIIVDQKYRGRGIGAKLIEQLMVLGKEKFHLEILHLEVYENNPAIHLYRRLGFEEFGFQKHFTKDNGKYLGKIYMQKVL